MKHGFYGTKFYKIFFRIKEYCKNPNSKKYKNFGKKGIQCTWKDFISFKNDMYESYLNHVNSYGEKDTVLDRIDINGNYCKENCKWSTLKERRFNKIDTIYYHNIPLKIYCKQHQLNYKLIWQRIHRNNMSIDEAIQKSNSRRRNLAGEKFGHWTVIKYVRKSKWLCQCDCGTKKEVYGNSLLNGKSKSCGCKINKYKDISRRLIKIYYHMIDRCYNINDNDYKNYGARGIKVCNEWRNDINNFISDMNDSYIKHINKFGEKDTTLDRIDVNGNYCKENCRWATIIEQANNRRNNCFITYRNETHTIAEWSKITGIKACTIAKRYKEGKALEQIFYHPLKYEEEQKIKELCKKKGYNFQRIFENLKQISLEDCLEKEKVYLKELEEKTKIHLLRFAYKKNNKNFYYFRCFCGNIFISSLIRIKSGHTKSCGCLTRRESIFHQKFGKLYVIKEYSKYVDNKKWNYCLCRCDCGKYIETLKKSLTGHQIKSCGCKYNKVNVKQYKNFYFVYQHLLRRCNNPKDKEYHNYGGRGIQCLWKKFEEFKNDMYDSYLKHLEKYGKENTTLDRINNDGNYCKENCRWATIKEQNRNKRTNVFLTYQNKTMTITDWSKYLRISLSTIRGRIRRGWTDTKEILFGRN